MKMHYQTGIITMSYYLILNLGKKLNATGEKIRYLVWLNVSTNTTAAILFFFNVRFECNIESKRDLTHQ